MSANSSPGPPVSSLPDIDTTPAQRRPPGSRIVNASNDLESAFVNVPHVYVDEPDEDTAYYQDVVEKLLNKGHDRDAVEWAIHLFVKQGRFVAEPTYLSLSGLQYNRLSGPSSPIGVDRQPKPGVKVNTTRGQCCLRATPAFWEWSSATTPATPSPLTEKQNADGDKTAGESSSLPLSEEKRRGSQDQEKSPALGTPPPVPEQHATSDAEALRAFVRAVNAYISFAEEITRNGKTIFNDASTSERHETLMQAIRDCHKAALVAGMRVGEPRREVAVAVLKQCADLCHAFALFWSQDQAIPHPDRKLRDHLEPELEKLDEWITLATPPPPANHSLLDQVKYFLAKKDQEIEVRQLVMRLFPYMLLGPDGPLARATELPTPPLKGNDPAKVEKPPATEPPVVLKRRRFSKDDKVHIEQRVSDYLAEATKASSQEDRARRAEAVRIEDVAKAAGCSAPWLVANSPIWRKFEDERHPNKHNKSSVKERQLNPKTLILRPDSAAVDPSEDAARRELLDTLPQEARDQLNGMTPAEQDKLLELYAKQQQDEATDRRRRNRRS